MYVHVAANAKSAKANVHLVTLTRFSLAVCCKLDSFAAREPMHFLINLDIKALH